MAKTCNPEVRAAICRAMGVPDPENVRRIVLDVESGQATRIYVERFGDDEALIRDLTPLLMADTPIGEPVADACPQCGEPYA